MKVAILSLISLFVATLGAAAESVTVLDTEFPVDAVESVDSDTVKLTIDGQSKLVERERLESVVVADYLSNPKLVSGLPFDSLSKFLSEALVKGESLWASRLLVRAFEDSIATDDEVTSLVDLVVKHELTKKILIQVNQELGPVLKHPEPFCRLFLSVLEGDLDTIRASGARWIYRYQSQCQGELRKLFFSRVQDGRLSEAKRALSIAGLLYGADDQGFQHLLALSSRVERLVLAIDSGDGQAAARALKPLGIPEDDEVISSIASGLAELRARVFVDEGEPLSALRLISLLDFKKRTPRLHALVLETLNKLSDLDGVVFEDSPILKILRSYSLKDDTIRKRYTELLDSTAFHVLNQGDHAKVNLVLDQLVILRPEPNSENDAIRIELARSLFSRGNQSMAQALLDEVQTGVPLSLKVQLMSGRLALNIWQLCAMLFVVFAAPGIFLYLRQLLRARPIKRARGPSDTPSQEELRRFVSVSRASGVDPEQSEYALLLATFGLADGATIQEIKVAYRNAVKECHPDLNPNAGPEQSARFIDLTKGYERLVKLHAEQRATS